SARLARLRQFLVAVRAVDADGRGVDQHPGPARRRDRVAAQRLHDVARAEDAAIDQQLFERLFPAAIEDVFAGQVNGAVATRGAAHPVSWLHRSAFDQLKLRTKRLPGNTKAARQDDGMVAPLQELLDQPLSDQARAAGDEDAHRLTSWDGSTKTSE